jgi:hypothetical protein
VANVVGHCGTGPPVSGILKLCRLALLAVVLALGPPQLKAATNAVTGGIGGINNGTLVGGDGTGLARIELFTVNLALIKQARDLSGTLLSDGSNVTPGQEIYFVLYVDNSTITSAPLQITDPLNEAEFTYITNSIEVTTVPSSSSDAAIWAGTWTSLTDVLGAPDDAASFIDSGGNAEPDRLTIGDVAGQANQAFSVPANSLRAIRFRVRID